MNYYHYSKNYVILKNISHSFTELICKNMSKPSQNWMHPIILILQKSSWTQNLKILHNKIIPSFKFFFCGHFHRNFVMQENEMMILLYVHTRTKGNSHAYWEATHAFSTPYITEQKYISDHWKILILPHVEFTHVAYLIFKLQLGCFGTKPKAFLLKTSISIISIFRDLYFVL